MRTYYKNVWLILACLITLWGCSKKPTDYRSFLDGQEITYPGKVVNPKASPGNLRLLLTWAPSPDPSVAKYVVYWNNSADSAVVSSVSHSPQDTVKCPISNLLEYPYSFFIYSYDDNGNRSVMTEIDNVQVYGPIYRGGLHNRLVNAANMASVQPDSSVILHFLPPDTINITTTIQYTNRTGVATTHFLRPDSNSITLWDYNYSSPIVYQSSFIPQRGALDTFLTLHADTFPTFNTEVMCDKGLFAEHDLSGDMGIYQSDTRVSKLWDGSVGPQSYPNIFHADGNGNLPRTLSFDMGKVYNNLSTIEETGRDCCNNPDDFEVWGIADITGAIPTLPANDPGWAAQSVSLGWTLLTEVKRTGDDALASSAYKASLMSNPPPVRYIRIRVLHDRNGENSYVNMSELTFWYKL